MATRATQLVERPYSDRRDEGRDGGVGHVTRVFGGAAHDIDEVDAVTGERVRRIATVYGTSE